MSLRCIFVNTEMIHRILVLVKPAWFFDDVCTSTHGQFFLKKSCRPSANDTSIRKTLLPLTRSCISCGSRKLKMRYPPPIILMKPIALLAVSVVLFAVRSVDGFGVASRSPASSLLHSMPPSYYGGADEAAGGLTSNTSKLKPGRSYAPTQAGVKHMGSRQDGYLANLSRTNSGSFPATYSSSIGSNVPSTSESVGTYVPDSTASSSIKSYSDSIGTYVPEYSTAPRRATNADSIGTYVPETTARPRQATNADSIGTYVPEPRAPTTLPTTPDAVGTYIPTSSIPMKRASAFQTELVPPAMPPKSIASPTRTMVRTAIMAPDGVGGRSASLHFNSRSDAFNYLESPAGKRPATEASVEMRDAGYAPPIGNPYTERPKSYAPTKSDVKFKSAGIPSGGYLAGLTNAAPAPGSSYAPPQQYAPPAQVQYARSGTTDPFAQSRLAANAVSRLLHADPRTGESVNPDPFAKTRQAAEAVSLLLLKSADMKDGLFYLT
jgi:hypothetical protein